MRYKVLTVDDSKTVRIIVKKAFKPFDCEILEAANGVEGLAVFGAVEALASNIHVARHQVIPGNLLANEAADLLELLA